MASSSCIKCGGFSFELRVARVAKTDYKMYFVQCVSCGGVVNAMPWFDVPALLHLQNRALKKIASALNVHVDLQT